MVRVRPRVAIFFCFHRNLSITGPKKLKCLLGDSDCLRKENLRLRLRRKRCRCANLLQSNQVKRTPQETINDFIIQKLNSLLVVDFRLISAFLYV